MGSSSTERGEKEMLYTLYEMKSMNPRRNPHEYG